MRLPTMSHVTARVECAAAILGGGHSRRLGQDKVRLDWFGDPLASVPAAAARAAGCAPVVLVGRTDHADLGPETLGVDLLVTDDVPDSGPLGGIVTAARRCPADRLVVLSCDLPFVDGATVVDLIEASKASGCAAVAHDGRAQVLVACYPENALRVLASRYRAGVRAVTGALEAVDVVHVEVPPGIVDDIDTPHAEREARRRARGDRHRGGEIV